MKCEYCEKENKENNGFYGSGRFCSPICARGWSTKEKRKEINEKVSNKLKGRSIEITKNIKEGILRTALTKKKNRILKIMNTNWLDLNEGDKRLKLLIEQDCACNKCNLQIWNEKYLSLEIHHIDGIKYNDQRENVELLCPNCHSQTNTWRVRKDNKSLPRRNTIIKYIEIIKNFKKQDVTGSSPVGSAI